jgi:hypothetical protein
MAPMSLLETTQAMLDHLLGSGMSLRQIARDCGDEVDYEWLKKFSAGKIEDPSVNRIQTLHDRLRTVKPDRTVSPLM